MSTQSVPSTPSRVKLNSSHSSSSPAPSPLHLQRLPSTPRTLAIVEIRNRHALQSTHSLSISHFTTLLTELNSSIELDNRIGFEQDRLDKIEQFRMDYMTGSLMKVKPFELEEGGEETYSDGTRRSSVGGTTTASSSQETDDASRTTRSHPRQIHQMPLDAVSRGVIAEKTIKRQFSTEGVLLDHKDYSSLARVARKAMKKTLKLNKPVYISSGLLNSVDWTNEYRQRGWAAPGIRFGPFKPDLIKFEKVQHKTDEEGDGQVSWEVVEVKYASRTRDVIYTNYKVQAIYYHLSLLRILSAVPSLVPSHKVSFFISHDPLAPQFLEKPLSVRTTQAFVEHHLFVLLPEWLRAVKETEWKRLQDKLTEKVTPSTPGTPSTTSTFLAKLVASQKKLPSSAFRPRTSPTRPSTPLVRSHTAPVSATPTSPTPLAPVSPESEDSFRSAPSSPLLSHSTSLPEAFIGEEHTVPSDLPPLPPADNQEEAELSALYEKIGLE
ncbi:hypothetical protein JCM3765_001948 [Sporobolomyces pararoseus]